MQPVEALTVDQIDLSDITFWERPWEEREGAFATLRRERPLAFFEEPDPREFSPLAPPPGPRLPGGHPVTPTSPRSAATPRSTARARGR